jgi:hypothetical protein
VSEVLGPKAQQLKQYVDAADDAALYAAGEQWSTGEKILRAVAKHLAERGRTFGTDERFSGGTADAASKAFQHSSEKMEDRADQMRQGSQAFHDAAHAVVQARKVSHQLDANAGDQPPHQPPDHGDAKAQSDYQTQKRQFWDRYADSETSADHAITALSENHTRQAKVFQSIHGETAPPAAPGPGGGASGGGAAAPPPVAHLPSTGPVRPPGDGGPVVPHHTHEPTTLPGGGHGPHGGDGGPTTVTAPGPAPGVHPPGPYGVPAGPGAVSPTGPLTGPLGAGAMPAGPGGVGAVGGVGAAAGGALGGALAAGLAGGLNGGLGGLNGVVPVGSARGGLAANGVRGIGSTGRTGVGSVLGRGSAAGRPGAGGMAGRNASRSGRGAAGRGSRGTAGSRRGAGAGAGAGRGGKDKKRQGEERDLFDDGDDWLDDEDAAPGVLD